jgi:hypothetical protein
MHYIAQSDGGTLRFSGGGDDLTGDVNLPSTNGEWRTQILATNVMLNAGVQSLRTIVVESAEDLALETLTITADDGTELQ